MTDSLETTEQDAVPYVARGKRHTQTHMVVLAIMTDKPIKDLANQIANRTSTMDGVVEVEGTEG